MSFIKKVLDYFRYPSTYAALFTLAGLLGVTLLPEQQDAIAKAGVAIVGAIFLFFSDADVSKAKK